MPQTWDPALYQENHAFVWKLASAGLLPLLGAQPGERILDLGCGAGQLTSEIAQTGANVTGMDSSPEMIEQARRNYPGLTWMTGDATDFHVDDKYDAVFSNAALHWVIDADSAVRCVAKALKPRGRFVAEFGGKGNIAVILDAIHGALDARGCTVANPWYFPSAAEYAALLEKHGFEIRFASLFERPTELADPERGLRDWIRMFGSWVTDAFPLSEREPLLDDIEQRARPSLYREGRWFADYKRIRVAAYLL